MSVTTADEKVLNAGFSRALQELLRSPLALETGPLYDIQPLGEGGGGTVFRGYVHRPIQNRERVTWFVVKVPKLHLAKDPVVAEQEKGEAWAEQVIQRFGDLVDAPVSGPPSAPVDDEAQSRPRLRWEPDNRVIANEHAKRLRIGDLPGFGPCPELVQIPASKVRRFLDPVQGTDIHAEKGVDLLFFEAPDADVAELRPIDLAELVRGEVTSARDLYNWCEIARALGDALLSLHAKCWIHRDLKLSNVVAQQEAGLLRSLELIDLGSAETFDLLRPGSPPSQQAMTSTYWRPERLRTGDHVAAWRVQGGAVDEDIYALGSLLGRVLLGRLELPGGGFAHPDSVPAVEIQRKVETRKPSPPSGTNPVALGIDRAFRLVKDLLGQRHTVGTASLSALLREVEQLRVAALDAMVNPRVRPAQSLGLVLDLLGSLEVYLDRAQEARWCENFRKPLAEVPPDPSRAPQAPQVEDAAALLRRGYVNAASTLLDQLIPAEGWTDPRALRLHVGQILLREGRDRRATEILAQSAQLALDTLPSLELKLWIQMLRAHLDFAAHREVVLHGIEPLIDQLDRQRAEHQENVRHGGRERVWHDALSMQVAVREGVRRRARGEGRPELDQGLLERLLSGVRHPRASTSERLYTILILALALAFDGQLVQALRWLHTGIGEAAARDFPIEYGVLLGGAAHALLLYPDRPALEREGLDMSALFDTAEGLAVDAADLFHRLGVDVERDHALRLAGQCGFRRDGTRGTIAAARWYVLAAANATLSPDARPFRSLELPADHDPGVHGAVVHYHRHGWALEKLWGTGGLSIEHVEGDRLAPPSALQALLALRRSPQRAPRSILVIGCGAGNEVFQLADEFPHARIHGVDVSSWNVAEAIGRARELGYVDRCTFRRVDLGRGEPLEEHGGGTKGPWDLVVMRETLSHATFKRSFLTTLRRRLQHDTEVLVSDFVQLRPAAPTDWRGVLDALGVTNLLSVTRLRGDFTAAGFSLPADLGDATPTMRAFFANRGAWLRDRVDPEAEALRGDPDQREWAEAMLGTIAAASEKDLGWVRFLAVADGDAPPAAKRGGSPHLLAGSTVPPPGADAEPMGKVAPPPLLPRRLPKP